MPVDHAICIVAYNSVSKQLLASNNMVYGEPSLRALNLLPSPSPLSPYLQTLGYTTDKVRGVWCGCVWCVWMGVCMVNFP